MQPADNKFEQLLLRIAGDRKGNISEERLEAWLIKISGRVIDGHRLVHTRNEDGKSLFHLERVPK